MIEHDAADAQVRVERIDDGDELLGRRLLGQLDFAELEADPRARFGFHLEVRRGPVLAADDDRRQDRRFARLAAREYLGSLGKRGFDAMSQCFAVESECHWGASFYCGGTNLQRWRSWNDV